MFLSSRLGFGLKPARMNSVRTGPIRKLDSNPELKHRAIEQNGYPGAQHFLFNHQTRTIAQ
ncbi:MAG: hypothetical protein B7X86_04580 [Sphingobacteriales bacterium 17-39-43]|nr:MAG: hypothetical protein B7X86_04580 [Sphingobacteriales bacterium 17-39-43]